MWERPRHKRAASASSRRWRAHRDRQPSAAAADHFFADGTSRQEIVAAIFFHPSAKSHVLALNTSSGSYVDGPCHRYHSSSPYSAQSGNIAAEENQSTCHSLIGATLSSPCFLKLRRT